MKTLLSFTISYLFFFSIKAQNPPELNSYFDSHLHIMKNYYRFVPHPDSMWSPQFCNSISGINWFGRSDKPIKDKVGFSGINGSSGYNQATFEVLDHSQASYLCVSFYSIEKQSAQKGGFPISMSILEKIIAYILYPFSKDVRLLSKNGFNPPIIDVNVAKVMQIDKNRLKLYNNSNFTNFREYQGQVRFLDLQVKNPPKNAERPIFFVRDHEQLDSLSKVTFNTPPIFLFATIEGGHNFYGKENASLQNVNSYTCEGKCRKEIFDNIRIAKNDNHHLFFVTLSHLFWNKMAGFARGLDVDNTLFRKKLAKAMWNPTFVKVDGKDGEGIIGEIKALDKKGRIDCNPRYYKSRGKDSVLYVTDLGWRVIDSLLSTDNIYHKPTFIDMRHMDVLARRQYIDYIKNTYKDASIPLIISHTAVSGKNEKFAAAMGLSPIFDNYEEFINPLKFYRHELFSSNVNTAECWKNKLNISEDSLVNLVHKTGWFHPMSNNLFDEEISEVYQSNGIIGITLEERALGKGAYNYKKLPEEEQLTGYFNNNYSRYFTEPEEIKDRLLKDLLSAEPFVRNLFYRVEKSGFKGTLKSWEHICIGSDFDGIMNPIDICPTAADIPSFYKFLVKNLNFYANFLGKNDLLLHKNPEDLMNMLFYLNGEQFIKKYF